jgi:serpin B
MLCLISCDEGTSTGNPHPDDPHTAFTLAKSDEPREQDPMVSGTDAARLGSDDRAFAFDMYAQLAKPSENLFFSPFSVSVALAMTYAGAKGTTADEMASALHFSLPQATLHRAFNAALLDLDKREGDVPENEGGAGFKLDIVDQAFAQKGDDFEDSYLDLLAINYGAGVGVVDFGAPDKARSAINDWVSERTKKRVPELLPRNSITSATKLVLTDAIYFKASWFEPFAVNDTQPSSFHAAAGDRDVEMMHAHGTMKYAEQATYQALDLEYLSRDVHMLLILPAEGRFDEVTRGLDAAFFDRVRGDLSKYLVTLSLPRWSFKSSTTLKAPFRSLGMNAAFERGAADFSGMNGGNDLYVDQIYHDAFIAVDEKGTEAAAATGVVINADGGIGPEYPEAEISFERPFIFAIYDEPTGQLLFLGQLVDPG